MNKFHLIIGIIAALSGLTMVAGLVLAALNGDWPQAIFWLLLLNGFQKLFSQDKEAPAPEIKINLGGER